VFEQIEQNKWEAALQQTEALIRAYPTFRLAHLVKGDLLMARVKPLHSFGEGGAKGAEDKVADLREEAIARLRAYKGKPPTDYVPRYLLQLRPDQKHAVVVDTQKSRLYLYQNDNGTPRFVADYYISHGKLGAEKLKEGDKKTPVGVYHVTASLPRQKLADLYGNGAFPLNYPNEWDKRHGRGGSGIWLHGTQSDTFSRPPLASDGCVVLTNPDLERVAKDIQIGLTPVIISNSMEWIGPAEWTQERETLNQAINAWRKDWESRDTEKYLAHYSRNFKTPDQDYKRFASQKRQVNSGKTHIEVKVSNLSLFRNPGKDDVVVATFDQDYRSNNLNNQMRKRQYWQREDGQWKIVYEGAA
jgi:murein L,D-transpeptidase YafK